MGVFLFTHMHKPKTGPLVVLAYSGGLDTSAIVPWLRETYGARVVCFAADVGQGAGELKGLVEKAKRSGAEDCIVEDLGEEFVRDFVFPTLRAGAVYARTYLLGTSMARPLTAAHQVAVAQRLGADAVAHGCTGKGNDQVRFELTYAALAPELQIIAPWREWKFQGREDLIAYVLAKGVPVQATAEKPYSTDRNLWHCSHEGGLLEDPSQEAPEHIFVMTKNPLEAPDEPVLVTIGFEEGNPVSVDAVPLGPVELLEQLNEVAGEHGVGRADIVEDRLVGMKSRGVYETPGGTVLYAAHRELEQMVLDRRTLRMKDELALRYADLVYDGRWWTPEREALDALFTATQKNVTGTVRLKLFKGNVIVAGRESPYALYQPSYATFGKDNVYNQKDAEGFIRLYGLASGHRTSPRVKRGSTRWAARTCSRPARKHSCSMASIESPTNSPTARQSARRTKTCTRWSSGCSTPKLEPSPASCTPAARATIRSRPTCVCGRWTRSTSSTARSPRSAAPSSPKRRTHPRPARAAGAVGLRAARARLAAGARPPAARRRAPPHVRDAARLGRARGLRVSG